MGEFGVDSGSDLWRQRRWENPRPEAVAVESWRRAERATSEIVCRIQPTPASEERRRAVLEYVQRLIKGYLGTEVFPFGSVPLKTYLPDGDIDLTALGVTNAEDTLAMDVCSILEIEEQNVDAEFEVKDVQYIHAEVKLVKCLVQNIVVDISFNQIGGLCTLCFLEQVDQLIGKNSLFKRSIILIKAWCYYESRILGAHHGLISTYALETLVLHIFHLFHSSLDGPLVVLYRFLDYYSKFDWDRYCISLHGPVAVSSLPQVVPQPPENEGGDLLLSSNFLKNCMDMFSVYTRGLDTSSRVFLKKHLNIVDPLKENNNLGRSVNKGNFFRIRSAFSYGARKLGWILSLPSRSIAEEINMFFMNTLERHGSGERPDMQGTLFRSFNNIEFDHNAQPNVEKGKEDKLILGSPAVDCHVAPLHEEFHKIKISESNRKLDVGIQSGNHPSGHDSSAKFMNKCTKMELVGPREGHDVSGRNLAGDAQDLASRPIVSESVNEVSKAVSLNRETGGSESGKGYHAPYLFYCSENGRGTGTEKLDHTRQSSNRAVMSLDNSPLVRPNSYETESSSSSSSWFSSNHMVPASAVSNHKFIKSSWNVHSSQNPHLVDSSLSIREDNGTKRSPESPNILDLTGDYGTHVKSLLYARCCQDYMLGRLFVPNDQSPSSHFVNSNYGDVFHGRVPVHLDANGVVPGPPFSSPGIYPIHPPFVPGAYATEDMPKPRGTGTYFPNTTYRERQPPGRGRAPVFTNQIPRLRNNGRSMMPPENFSEKSRHETYRQSQPPSYPAYSGNGRGKPALLDIPQHSNSNTKVIPLTNGFTNSHEGRLEFGSFDSLQNGHSSSELGKKLDPVSPQRQGSGLVIPVSTVHRQGTSLNNERTNQAYQLKNEDDFPPLI